MHRPARGAGGEARPRERAERAYRDTLDGLIARHPPLLIELFVPVYRVTSFSLPPGPPERSELV